MLRQWWVVGNQERSSTSVLFVGGNEAFELLERVEDDVQSVHCALALFRSNHHESSVRRNVVVFERGLATP